MKVGNVPAEGAAPEPKVPRTARIWMALVVNPKASAGGLMTAVDTTLA